MATELLVVAFDNVSKRAVVACYPGLARPWKENLRYLSMKVF